MNLKHKFHSKQTPIRHRNSLGPNMTYDERVRCYFSKALDVLGRLTTKIHETWYLKIEHNLIPFNQLLDSFHTDLVIHRHMRHIRYYSSNVFVIP